MTYITAKYGMRTGKPTIANTRMDVGTVFEHVHLGLAGYFESFPAGSEAEERAVRFLWPLLAEARERAEVAAGKEEFWRDPEDDRGHFEHGVAFGLMVALEHCGANGDRE